MLSALNKPLFESLSLRVKTLFVNILFSLKSNKPKIKLALVNLNGLLKKVLGEDCFIGLELDA